jgi:hypothetical protein
LRKNPLGVLHSVKTRIENAVDRTVEEGLIARKIAGKSHAEAVIALRLTFPASLIAGAGRFLC